MTHTSDQENSINQTVDMIFFHVSLIDDPSPSEMCRLIKESKHGDFCDLNIFNGKEHSYLEIGAWIGDQELALKFMGLGYMLGIFKLLTPRSMGMPPDLVLPMAERGLITVVGLELACKK